MNGTPGALDSSERDAILADLGELLEVLGLGDYARPESPHEVFTQCLAGVRNLAGNRDDWSERAAGLLTEVSGLRALIAEILGEFGARAAVGPAKLDEWRERAGLGEP